MLNDKDARVCREAVYALGKLGAKEAVPELMKQFYVATMTGSAIIALGDLGTKDIVPELERILKEGDDNALRQSAAYALGEMDVKEMVPELVKLLKDDKWLVHRIIINSLELYSNRVSFEESSRIVRNEVYNVRKAAAYALARMGAKEAIPELIKLTQDKNKRVRGWAAIALVDLGEKSKISQELIGDIKTVKSGSKEDKKRALKALNELGVAKD